MLELISRLAAEHRLTLEEYERLVSGQSGECARHAASLADSARRAVYGTDVYIRGLIEIGNVCRNDCYYCGIRRSNADCERYVLGEDTILGCCAEGYSLGFRSFVLQGGEGVMPTGKVCSLVSRIRTEYPDCAITLSLGEYPAEDYRRMREAGADRYLLRHETADRAHYRALHPPELTLANRMRCLLELKELGFQVGCGFMVGSPHQTARTLAKDLKFIESFQPDMCGIGPFMPHRKTPLRGGADDISSLAHKAHKAEHPPARDDRAGQREPRWPRARPVCRRERHNAESVALRRAKQVFALRQQAFKRQGIGAESCTFEKLRAGDRVPYRDCARRHKKRLNIPRLPERAI